MRTDAVPIGKLETLLTIFLNLVTLDPLHIFFAPTNLFAARKSGCEWMHHSHIFATVTSIFSYCHICRSFFSRRVNLRVDERIFADI